QEASGISLDFVANPMRELFPADGHEGHKKRLVLVFGEDRHGGEESSPTSMAATSPSPSNKNAVKYSSTLYALFMKYETALAAGVPPRQSGDAPVNRERSGSPMHASGCISTVQ
ncbi:hypothetical protein FOZ62_003109, partial [Perkinsus olseni]